MQFNPSSRRCGSLDRPGFAPGYGAHRIRLACGLVGPGILELVRPLRTLFLTRDLV